MFYLKVIVVFRRCNVHTVHTNVLLLIYMSVMHVQNQNMATLNCGKNNCNHKNVSTIFHRRFLICPRS